MSNAYRVNSEQKSDQNRASTAEQCFACKKFSNERKSLERHLRIYGCIPGIIYKFENRNIQIDNMKCMCGLPFAIYFDFKTTSGKKTTILKRIVHFIQFLIYLWLLFIHV